VRPGCRAAVASIDRYLLPAPDLSSKPPRGRRCCCRSTGQTDGWTDGRTLDRFMTLAAYFADRVLMSSCCIVIAFFISLIAINAFILRSCCMFAWSFICHPMQSGPPSSGPAFSVNAMNAATQSDLNVLASDGAFSCRV